MCGKIRCVCMYLSCISGRIIQYVWQDTMCVRVFVLYFWQDHPVCVARYDGHAMHKWLSQPNLELYIENNPVCVARYDGYAMHYWLSQPNLDPTDHIYHTQIDNRNCDTMLAFINKNACRASQNLPHPF